MEQRERESYREVVRRLREEQERRNWEIRALMRSLDEIAVLSSYAERTAQPARTETGAADAALRSEADT